VSQVVRVAWYRFRTTFGHRRGGYLSVVLLIGLVGGLAMGAVAGARRTESSFPTYLASTNPFNAMILTAFDDPALGQSSGYNERIDAEIAHLRFVTGAATEVIFDGNINLNAITGVHSHFAPGETPPVIEGGLDGAYTTLDRLTLLKGRFASPGRADEAVMNAQAAKELGVHVGSVIHIPFYTDAETSSASYNGPPHLVAKVKLVGEVVSSTSVVESDIAALGSGMVVLSPALTRELAPCCAYVSGVGLRIEGGVTNAERVRAEAARISAISRLGIGGSPSLTSEVTDAQRAIKPEAVALGVFGGIAGLAVLLIAALMIDRLLIGQAEEAEVLRALGADRKMALSDGLTGLFAAIVIGAVLGVVVAVGLSPLTPLGPVRPVYPDPGVGFDWSVLGLGFLALIAVLGSVAFIFAGRELNRLMPSARPADASRQDIGVARTAAQLPVSVGTGVRFALESGRGRTTAPVRSAILGTLLAIVALVTTITFGASLDSLLSRPALYGWNWNYMMLSGFAGEEDLPGDQTAAFLNADHDVAAWSGVNFVGAKLDGQEVQMLAEEPGARVAPPVLSGHGLQASDQIVLGGTTLAALHKKVGDTVTFDNGRTRPQRLVIVGTATMPTIANGLEMGTGALAATGDFPSSLLNSQQSPIPGPNAILVRIRAGASPTAAYRSLQQIDRKVKAIRGAGDSAGGVVSVLRPAEIVNYRSMGTTPAILGAGLSIGALIALGLTLVASVRRRSRDLALLKTLGFTRRQLAVVIASQSSVAVLVGLVAGIPSGIVLGRALWDTFAHEINAVPAPTVPVTSIVLIALGALVLANIVAAVPERMAARTPTAWLLRAE
jgi:hypothetical protein